MEEIHSTWGEWVPREIAAAEPAGLRLWYLGCNGVALKSSAGTTVFIDPYLGTGDPPRTVRMIPVPFEPADVREADAILATHEHTDHVHGPSQAPIVAGTAGEFYAPGASMAVTESEDWTGNWEVTHSDLNEIGVGDVLEIGDLTIHVEVANDPDAEEPVSYVVEHEAGTFFHGGDSRPGAFGDIGSEYDIDLGVIAFGTVGMLPDKETRVPERTRWYSDENMFVEAANELELDRAVPTHWDMWRGMTADPTALYTHARSFEYPRRLEIVEIGETVEL